MTVLFDNGIWIELLPENQSKLWQQCDTEDLNPVVRWQTYIQQLCLQGVLPWLNDEFQTLMPIEVDKHCQHDAGIALTIGSVRLMVMPSEDIDQSELRVPQMWVEEWSQPGDYYLAVQVNPDEGQLHVWGYTDHETLTQNGAYDPVAHTYSLGRGAMITDLAILTAAHQLGVTSFGTPSIQTIREDRQAVSFPGSQAIESSRTPGLTKDISKDLAAIDISQWLDSKGSKIWMVKGWQLLDTLLPTTTPDMAVAFRWISVADENGKGQSQGKRLEFLGSDGPVCLILLVRVTAEEDGRLGIRVQLRPETFDSTLPDGVRLVLVSPTEEIVQSVQSRALDSFIQLKRFRVPPKTGFSIQVHWGNTVMTEAFTTGPA